MFIRTACVALLSLGLLAACRKEEPVVPVTDFTEPLPEGMLALRKITPAEYPDFGPAAQNLHWLEQSINHSLTYLEAGSSRRFFPYLDITHDRAYASLLHLRTIVREEAGRNDPDRGSRLNARIKADFEVYKSVGARDPNSGQFSGRVLFTGYFTPTYDASLTRTAEFQYPLYKRPADLATDPVTGEANGRRLPSGAVVPYLTRAEIDGPQKPLAGTELVYLRSRFEAYIVSVQGSARLRLPDGRIFEIGFAGHNGYDYVPISLKMVDDGVLTRSQINLQSMRQTFAAKPELGDKYMSMNPRYVFFAERPGGPFGSLNVPVTPWRSIATDKGVYPRALPAYVNVPSGATNTNIQIFMLDQDTGGAIRAAGRTDIYMGIGDSAERSAGQQLNEGLLYYIAVKPALVGKYPKPPVR